MSPAFQRPARAPVVVATLLLLLSSGTVNAERGWLAGPRGDLQRLGRSIKAGVRSWAHLRLANHRARATQRRVSWARRQLKGVGIEASTPVKVYSDHTRRAAIYGKLAARTLGGARSKVLRSLARGLERRAERIDQQRVRPMEQRRRLHGKNRETLGFVGFDGVRPPREILLNGDKLRARQKVLSGLAHENQHARDFTELVAINRQFERLQQRAGANPTPAQNTQAEGLARRWSAIAGTDSRMTRVEDRAFATQARVAAHSGVPVHDLLQSPGNEASGYKALSINRAVITHYISATRDRLAARLRRATPRQAAAVESYLRGYRKFLAETAVDAMRERVTPKPPPAATSERLERAFWRVRDRQLTAAVKDDRRGQRRAERQAARLVGKTAKGVRSAEQAFAAGWLAASVEVPASTGAARLFHRRLH